MNGHIAFFDLDHTILNTNSGVIMVKEAHRKKLIRKKDILSGMVLSIFYKAGLINAEIIMKRMAAWLKGTPEEKFKEFADETFQKYIEPLIRKSAREAISNHQRENGKSVLLSASTPYICRPIKELLKMDDYICSKMEVIEGYFTGYPDGKYCYETEKLVRTLQYCEEHDFRLENAYYYADSISDLKVLEAVGHPRCVTPDSKLLKIARSKGWEVLNW